MTRVQRALRLAVTGFRGGLMNRLTTMASFTGIRTTGTAGLNESGAIEWMIN